MIVVVRNCKDCPFCVDRDGRMFCNVSTPKKREILLEDERPNFCKLRRGVRYRQGSQLVFAEQCTFDAAVRLDTPAAFSFKPRGCCEGLCRRVTPLGIFLQSLPEIDPATPFTFACHPNVGCFNACCGDLNLLLTPYDVLRLCRGLNLPSAAVLEKHCELGLYPDTGFPAIHLRDGR